MAVAAVSFLAGFLSGGIGFASGVLPAALLSLMLPATVAVPLLAPIVLLAAIFALPFHWKTWSARHVLVLAPTLLAGTWLGTSFLHAAPESLVEYVIAAFVAVAAVSELTRRADRPETGPNRVQRVLGSTAGGVVVGLIGGVTSAMAHAGGVVVAAYLLSAGIAGRLFTGTILAVLVMGDLAKLVAFAQADLFTPAMVRPVLSSVPFLVLGVLVGWRGYRRIPVQTFRKVVAVVLLAVAVLMVVSR